MATFHAPQISPFQVPQNVGTGNVQSRYLFNNYRIEWDPSKWRYAIDNALQYSNLVSLDALYSWCLQASPFLVSQINKRLIPIYKRNFAFSINGNVQQELTDKYIKDSWWFKKYMRYILLSKFYGVKLISLDPKKHTITDFPLRNIDIFNKGIRQMTYEYTNIINAADYDDLFFFEPETDQDFRLGMLQPISRAMIGIVDTFVNWQILGAQYSRPFMTIGYDANNTNAKNQAVSVAQNIDLMTVPIIPFTSDYNTNGKSIYTVEVNSRPTQANSDAFRVFKEYVLEYRSEIMQLVTGGTLLGATEKNTNSEQLAEIHMELYRDILDADSKMAIDMFNSPLNKQKLSRLFNDKTLENVDLVEIPDKTVSQKLFVDVGTMLAKQNAHYTPEAFEKVGLSPDDIVFEEPKKSKLGAMFTKK